MASATIDPQSDRIASLPLTEAASSPRMPQDKCVTVIFNPVSGQGDPEERKRRIAQALADHGYGCQEMITTRERGARALAEQALREGIDLLAVSGGDGTVVETMSALIGTSVPLAIFPAGTGNLLSVNLGLPRDVPQAVHAALYGERRKLDLARITPLDPVGEDRYFAILAGAGYDAWVIHGADRESKNRLGVGAYLLSALKNLRHRPVRARIHLEERSKVIRRRAKSVMVANMGLLQGGLIVVPDAWPDDGQLDIAILKAETLNGWLHLAASAVLRRLRQDPNVEYLKTRRVKIELSRPQPLQYDGEEATSEIRAFSVEVLPAAIEVMVPGNSPI